MLNLLAGADIRERLGGVEILRIGFGLLFIFHGAPKLFEESWTEIGTAMTYLGIDFFPTFWGFLAALVEFGGGIFLLLGLFTRPVSLVLLFTMFVAVIETLGEGGGFGGIAHPLKAALVFLFFVLEGPGNLSLGKWLLSRRRGGVSRPEEDR